MPFHRPPPPSYSFKTSSSRPHPVPLEHTSSSSSSVPSLISDGSTSSIDSDALASPLRRLSLHDVSHSPCRPRKQRSCSTSSLASQDSASNLKKAAAPTRENMFERKYHQEHRSIGTDVDLNMGREASSFPLPPPSARPSLPQRTSSYSKRHASFDSPREVPLPYMPLRQPSYTSASTTSTQTHGAAAVHDSDPNSRLSCLASDHSPARSIYDENAVSPSTDSTPSPLSPSPTSASMGGESKAARSSVSEYMDLSEPSSSSMHFHSSRPSQHPRTQSPRLPSSSSTALPLFSRPFSSPDASRPILSPRPMRPPGVPDRASTASLPLPADTPYYTLPPLSGGAIQEDTEMRSAGPTRPSSSRPSLGSYQASTSSIPSLSSWQARRSPSLASEMEHEEFMSLVASRILDRAYSSARADSDAASTASDRPLPPPAPPTVLTPPPPPLSQDRGPAAPYEPFLAHAPPPQESYIAVDTKPTEYRLLVRLPGFKRDAITVSTRKRRILHVVADSWEPDGGHFEQRISFGYDAILALVRAEFDGEHLQVIVPRRMVPMTYQPVRE